MDRKCSLGAMNGNIQFIGLVMLICIVIIVAIYYFCNVNNKHSKILEKYQVDNVSQISNTNYGANHVGNYSADDLPKFSNRKINSRECQVYFANEDVCDNENDDKNSTCKYVFEDGWKEINSISGSGIAGDTANTNIYNKKIYNQNYTRGENDIPNFKEMAGCFKKVNSDEDNRFLYNSNPLVKYGYGGAPQSKMLTLNVDGEEGQYITMYFDNDTVPQNNYNNIIDSICSLNRDTIAGLRNITTNSVNPYFYKFGIDKNNNVKVINISKWVNIGIQKPSVANEIINIKLSTALTKKTKFTAEELKSFELFNPSKNDYIFSNGNYFILTIESVLDITIVELNLAQNAFISHGIADFVQSSVIGIEYKNTTQGKINFNVFKQSSLPDMKVEIYQFKYNYLCNNNILEYLNQVNTTISLNSFIEKNDKPEDGKKQWSINSYPQITTAFWDNYKAKQPRQDQKFNIIADLRTIMKTESDNLNNSSDSITIIELTETKNKWEQLKTIADNAKNSFHTITFTELMNVTKDAFTDVEGKYSNNSTIKPFNYELGYNIYKENPESPYNPSITYGTKPYVQTNPLNKTLFSYNLVQEFGFGLPGIKGVGTGTHKRKGYFGSGWGNKYIDNRTTIKNASSESKSNITDFRGINSMGYGTGELYSWYWEGYFVAHEEGNYHFATWSDDDSFVWLDNVLVVNNGGLHGWRGVGGYNIYLKKGEVRYLEITFSENYGGDNIYFGWYNSNNHNSWIHDASWNNKTYIYQTITKNTIKPTVETPTWRFVNGSYYTEIGSDTSDIVIDSITINDKKVSKEGTEEVNVSPDTWIPLIYNNGIDNEPYKFFIKEGSSVKKVYLKAVDKEATLQKKTMDVLSGGQGGEYSFNNTTNNENFWWNRSVESNSKVEVDKYKLARITVTSFIYLQKGLYKFNTSMNFPSTLEIHDSNIKIKDIEKDSNNNYRIDRGKFYMMTYSCYALNNTGASITAVFSLTADFKSYDNSIEKRNENMMPYIYGGKKLYSRNEQRGFMEMFEEIKVFEPNTSEDFRKIKEFLTLPDGGNDFWNLTLINAEIKDKDNKLRSSNEILAASKKRLEDNYNSTIDSIDGLNYDNEFMKNTEYFNNPEIQYKSGVKITSIFTNMNEQDMGITEYITYEKINDKAGRISKERGNNFNIVNNADRSIYLLKSSIIN